MKIAICHYSLRHRWAEEKWNVERLIQQVKALGADGIDFHAGLLGSSRGAGQAIREALLKHKLALAGISLSNNFNQDDPALLHAQVKNVIEWLRVAAEAGAGVARIFGGNLAYETRKNSVKVAVARRQILDGLSYVTREAEKLGVTLALENHDGMPCTAEEQVEMIRKINSPRFKATVDIGNYMQCGQEAHVALRMAAPYAAYVHFKDFKKVPDNSLPWRWNVEACIPGEGDVNIRACLEALDDVRYKGFVALEYEAAEDEKTALPKCVKYMNEVMKGL